jgi:hypothetical protein
MVARTPTQQTQIVDLINEIKQAVLGYNGNPGLVSDMRDVRTRLASLEDNLNELTKTGCKFGQVAHRSPDAKDRADDKITFQWLVEKLGAPVITGITTAVLVASIINYVK